MKYKGFKFEFKTPVHFGNGTLTDSVVTLHSDTIFSAMCIEAIKNSQEALDSLVELFATDKVQISDAFPYVDDVAFVPKPCCYVERNENTGSSVQKKNYKKLQYISAQNIQKFFTAEYDPKEDLELIGNLGESGLKKAVSIKRDDDSEPFNIGTFTFSGTAQRNAGKLKYKGHNGGLYIIVGYENDDDFYTISDYLEALSYTGLGGKLSAGLGKFELKYLDLPDEFVKAINSNDTNASMLLSCALPTDEEMPQAMDNAQYSLIKRSGFVQSYTYADSPIRKKDLFVFNAGSCFANKFKGDIYDVSRENTGHPVYKYEKPMWLGVNL